MFSQHVRTLSAQTNTADVSLLVSVPARAGPRCSAWRRELRDLENKQMEDVSKLRDSEEDKSRGVDLSREVLQVFAISSELEQNERREDDSRQRRVRPETLERD